ncbi:MAG: hypothetical protein IMZ52_02285, partial [Actinobacteria bacterium]|nr:hypothetical protein [Actinomycetota bacterium]
MTDELKLTPEERIIKAKIRIGADPPEGRPFFSFLVSHLKFQERKECPTMGVSAYGDCYWNPKFIESLTDDEIYGVLCHEIMHVVLEHMTLAQELKQYPELANIASDIVVNNILIKDNMKLPDKQGALVPKDNKFNFQGYEIEKIDTKSSGEIYDELHKYFSKKGKEATQQAIANGEKGRFDEHIHPKEGEGEGKDGDGKEGEGKSPFRDENDLKNHWRKVLLDACAHAKNRGSVPVGMERIIGDLIAPKVNWRTYLFKYISSMVPMDYTWSRPSKRTISTGIYLPSTEKESIEIIASIDTSGCFVGDTLIYTDEGIKEIRDIINPISLINSDFSVNKLDMVNKKFVYKAKKIITIKTKSGKEIKVTPNHKIFIYVNNFAREWGDRKNSWLKKGKIIEKRADEIRKNDWLITTKKIDFSQNKVILPEIRYNNKYLATPNEVSKVIELSGKHSGYEIHKLTGIGSMKVYRILKGIKPKIGHPVIPSYINRDFAEVLGMICGDGNLSICKNSFYAQITDKNIENLQYYQILIRKLNINSKITNHCRRQRLSIYSKEFVNYLKTNFEDIVVRSRYRNIPNLITVADDDVICGFIRGFFDAEGHIGEHDLTFSNTSKKLIYQLQMLLNRLGIYCYIESSITPERKIGDNIIKETLIYKLKVTGRENIKKFYEMVGVTRNDKKIKIEKYLRKTKNIKNSIYIDYNDYIVLEKVK